MNQPPLPDLALRVADRLAHPALAPRRSHSAPWWRQSLAHGIPGIALLHIELAAAEMRPWQRVHDWLSAATTAPITSGPDSHPFYGAPALAHPLACAAEQLPGAYKRTLDGLDQNIAAEARRRVAAAHRRIDRGELPQLAEFDALQGLTGYGAYLLRRDPNGPAVHEILTYLVRLTAPLTHDGDRVPGWWTTSGPSGRPDDRFPDGHANNSLAHGITGVLSLLSLAARRRPVPGQLDAIRTICAWLDRWHDASERGSAWPYWVTRTQVRSGRVESTGALRPSWCYGTAGLARAQQLAALALGDRDRQLTAERELLNALTDRHQLAATTDIALCHGFAGLAHVAARTADDALPTNAGELRTLVPTLLTAVLPPGSDPENTITELMNADDGGPGLLDGTAGLALATLAPETGTAPRSAWDACLLIS
ncbi:lanthionine synthetase C family protein [Streptomyces sp. LHD-70]|uniref:lanthionine synthetase C family protein n=1 Tax=Streptomyces sp. LHD-70 TaxID=3072140 RepID=UPI00280EA970|nr:lanthionine synthetase C family protein [Streptomyces sp. LHD-70]MDQ8706950.1 lanthionine synthetase C family protein [Streptomyces sp. LHD-70]